MGNHRRLWIFSLGPLVFSYCQCLVRYLPFEDFDLSTPGEWLRFKVMVFNSTFNNISVISLRSILLVEETWVPGETIDLPQVTDKLNNLLLYRILMNIIPETRRSHYIIYLGFYIYDLMISCLYHFCIIHMD
jgi:hypothetical protein